MTEAPMVPLTTLPVGIPFFRPLPGDGINSARAVAAILAVGKIILPRVTASRARH